MDLSLLRVYSLPWSQQAARTRSEKRNRRTNTLAHCGAICPAAFASFFVPSTSIRCCTALRSIRSKGILCSTSAKPQATFHRTPARASTADGPSEQRLAAGDGDFLETPAPEAKIGVEEIVAVLKTTAASESAMANPLGLRMSHELIALDDDGMAPRERFVYVEEQDCIGCTHCATTARSTFFLEAEYGRARVYDQMGDSEGKIEEAVDTCPVNCIYYVSWSDLVILEQERINITINNWSRLVGAQSCSSSMLQSKASISNSGIMRCSNCPKRGCPECPLYGVGQNPFYQKRILQREKKKKERRLNSVKARGNLGGSVCL